MNLSVTASCVSLCPEHIPLQFWQEWLSSCIDLRLIEANLVPLSGNEAIQAVCYAALDQMGAYAQQYATREVQQLLNTYDHLQSGGWAAYGLDPFKNWERMEWSQFKPLRPRPDKDKPGKVIKYESPPKTPTRAYFLELPWHPRFWLEALTNPGVPIILVEGAKKAAALLSLGYVAIAVPGASSAYRVKDQNGNRIDACLIPELEHFAQPGRRFILAFDQDSRPETRRKVMLNVVRLGRLLQRQRCEVAIATWNGSNGKGPDDLIANKGPQAFHQAFQSAMPMTHWEIWQRLERKLTFPPNLKVHTHDLSTLDLSKLPDTGIIALKSDKGTGKTKLINLLIALEEKVLSLTHRVVLARNQCSRMNLDYRGDLDKANGNFINEDGYTLRVATCIDSLLAINPEQFAGGTLIVDETVQVIGHTLNSSTCNKDGRRPALLARFEALVRSVKRIIIADADLDNATLRYLRTLRGSNEPLFLLWNTFQRPGFDVRFVLSGDRTPIVADLMADLEELPDGKVLLVTTDSKAASKAIAQAVETQHPHIRTLILNSETSGGECEREFIQSPDAVLERGEYDLIIASPSMATGVSIEAQGVITRVYGIFVGASSNDADIAQALGRVREPVQRVVWCAPRGFNLSRVSGSSNPLQVRSDLQQRTSAAIRLIRNSLQAGGSYPAGLDQEHDWLDNPHLNLYAQFAADQNASMYALRDALLVRLEYEGNRITVEHRDKNRKIGDLLKAIKQEIRTAEAQAIVAAEVLSHAQVSAIEQRDVLSPEERHAIALYYFREFYCLEDVTKDDILADNEGRRRGELLNLEQQLYPGLAADRATMALEKQAKWGQHTCPWDLSNAQLRQEVRKLLGLNDFLDPAKTWTREDLEPYAERARQYAKLIRDVLRISITDKMSDAQVVHQLLSQMGLKVDRTWSRSCPGYEGTKISLYRLNAERWQDSLDVITRRKAKRDSAQKALEPPPGDGEQCGSPTPLTMHKQVGDPGQVGTSASFDPAAGVSGSSFGFSIPSNPDRGGGEAGAVGCG